ncbi:unnamed protein product [Caenorhabditis sp. 36 PRJEB53466]|nr:unnamed protein product [Caenorhabditis sp. 36 PRJEB53466]
MTASEVAAAAAERRLQKKNEPQVDASKKRIQMIAKQQLDEERRRLEELNISDQRKSTEAERPQELEHGSAISRVLYTCELLGEDLVGTKAELLKEIEKFLLEQIHEADDENDKWIAAVLMIYSLNKSAQKELAITTISTVCENILKDFKEEKYKRIRLSNPKMQTNVLATVGGRAFLESVGFEEQSVNGEPHLVYTRSDDVHLVHALEVLKDGEPVPIKVARNMELFVLREGQQPRAPKLAADFFNLSATELKAEQKAKEMQVERMLTLRTKEMRQKDEQLSNYRYKYTLIRVRVPGNVLIQGVFGCHEPFSAVRVFIASALSAAHATSEFSLRDAVGQLVEDESATLAQLSLAPAALLHLVFAQIPTETEGIIADEYIHLIKELEQ